jgi:hypothetical protein
MKSCLYCGLNKDDDEFSDEHIWPDALGGDYLSSLWRTDEVCRRCNSISGVFVDGAFIKSVPGAIERWTGAYDYLPATLSLTSMPSIAPPLAYTGRISDPPPRTGHASDVWLGPCGANIIHVRPDDAEPHWSAYAGGDPRAKKLKAGRAYLALTSAEPFWIAATLAAFRAHFERAKRYVINMNVPEQLASYCAELDRSDPVQAADMVVVDAFIAKGRDNEQVANDMVMRVDVVDRFLAKLALAIGYRVLGGSFLESEYSRDLRRAFREADMEKRKAIPILGSGYWSGGTLGELGKLLAWPGGWVLSLMRTHGKLALTILTPSGKDMVVCVCHDPDLVAALPAMYDEGQVWLTVPSLGRAVGPITWGDYLAHRLGQLPHADLADIERRRTDPNALTPCR